MKVEEIKQWLRDLVAEMNSLSSSDFGHIQYHEQNKEKGNMSVTRSNGDGRIYVQPRSSGCDISLSGKNLEKEMRLFMRNLFGRECDGYKQKNESIDKYDNPFWISDDFLKVKEVICYFAGMHSVYDNRKRRRETSAPQEMSAAPLDEGIETFREWSVENERRAAALSLSELVKKAELAAPVAQKVELTSSSYVRNPYVSTLAKRLAQGICDLCQQSAPFLMVDAEPYLESHHVVWLSHGGVDLIQNVVALCPNCHRKMHYLENAEDLAVLNNRLSNRSVQIVMITQENANK
jgi:hypothetical protein